MKKNLIICNILQLACCFTFSVNNEMILILNGWIPENAMSDYNHSSCNTSDYHESGYSYFLNVSFVNNTIQYDIDSAFSFFVTGSDLSIIWLQLLFFLSNLLPKYWMNYHENKNESRKKIKELFFVGALLAPVSLGCAAATGYGLLELLSLDAFNIQPGALCFLNQLSMRTLWILSQLCVKSWLEQFYFSLGLIGYVVKSSCACLFVSLLLMLVLPEFNIRFLYMMISAITESALIAHHFIGFFLIPQLRDLNLCIKIPLLKDLLKSFLHLVKESFFVILAITAELLAQPMTSFFSALHGGSAPAYILKAQKNFYLAYLLQSAASLFMAIEVSQFSDKPKEIIHKVVKDNLIASSMICLPTILVTAIVSMLFDSSISYYIYALGAGISCSELLRTLMLSALKVLDFNGIASITVSIFLGLAEVSQYFYMSYGNQSQMSDETVAKNLLGIQLTGSVVAGLATVGLYAKRALECKKKTSETTELEEQLCS